MKSSKCPNCSLVQWAESDACKRCGASLASHQSSYVPAAPAEWQAGQQGHGPYYAQPQLKSGLAITSMVLAIVAFPTTFLLIGLLIAPVAVVMGIVALVRANRQPMTYGGKGFAIAGISVGSVVCVLFVPLIAAIAIPNLLASRRAANEGSAIRTIELIARAQLSHASIAPSGACGDITELVAKSLLDPTLASGKKNGYRFTSTGSSSDDRGCEVRATPESESDGNRSFYFSSVDGVVRFATNGKAATSSDAPLVPNRRS